MNFIKKQNLVVKILIGLLMGFVLGFLYKYLEGTIGVMDFNSSLLEQLVSLFLGAFSLLSVLGTIFVGSLKSIAPLLVFILIISALSKQKSSSSKGLVQVIILYVGATLVAAFVAVILSFLFPVTLNFTTSADVSSGPSSVMEVLGTTLNNLIDNPIKAIATGNYLGILFWASLIGVSLKSAGNEIKKGITQLEEALTKVIKFIISFAPLGIMGIVFGTIVDIGFKAMLSYGQLIVLLLSAMLIMLFIIDPIIVYFYTRENPYKIIFKCLSTSGLSAFFTRSSAANIPVNLELCKELDVDEELYSVSIPLGATINMTGAAITITILTLAAANTEQILVTFPMAIVLSIVAALSACGASGVPGGSLLLLTTSTALFNMDASIASQIIAVGYVISVIQDSAETALNSASDALYTIIVDRKIKRKNK